MCTEVFSIIPNRQANKLGGEGSPVLGRELGRGLEEVGIEPRMSELSEL